MGLIQKIFGTYSDHQVKKLMPVVDKIEALAPAFAEMSDADMRAMTDKFKDRLNSGETLDDILPEAFALVREAADRVLGKRPFRVQLLCGILLHQGRIAEMKTGEGKTLVAVLPSYLNALKGEGVHIVTVYDSATGSIRVTRAAGRVMARTERTVEVQIPLVYEEKAYKDPFLGEIELHFFNFSQKIFKNSRNSNILCDIIKYNANLGQLGNNQLPLSLSHTEVRPYSLAKRSRSPEEALALCYEELASELSLLSQEVQILQKNITTEIRDDTVVLVCTITCIENIATVQEFEITQ